MTLRTRIKICGITSALAAIEAANAGADALGFVFHKPSPRYIKPEQVWELLPYLPPFVASVGLFVNAGVDEFCEIEELCPTVLSQLHGQESVDVVTQCGPNIIKAVRFDEATIDAELARWTAVPAVAAILIDGSAGGEGKTFDWNLLAGRVREIGTPIIIAGGLTPKNVAEAIRIVRPYGVDVSSGVESAPGIKDSKLMAEFCKEVTKADAAFG